MIMHSLQQLFAGRSWPGKTAATTAGPVCRAVGARGRSRLDVRSTRWRVGSLKHPSGCLAMPHESVSDKIQIIACAEVHKRIGRTEFISIRALPRMDECPFQIVLRGNL